MSRYTRSEFGAAGIEPQECDGTAYPGYNGEAPYWFACSYHSGYLDRSIDALTECPGGPRNHAYCKSHGWTTCPDCGTPLEKAK